MDPKGKLGDIIFQKSEKRKRYLNTAHNKAIAAHLDIDRLRRALPSFSPLYAFLNANL